MISQEADFIRSLIDRFPEQQKDWEKKIDEHFKSVAETEFPDDKEEASKMYYEYSEAALGNCEFEKGMFFKSMFLMVYVYYESMLKRLASEVGIPLKQLFSNQVHLDKEKCDDKEFILHKVKELRNHICHNGYKNESETREIVNEISEKYPNVIMTKEGSVEFYDSIFILELLEKERRVLVEVANQLGFLNKKS